MRVFLLLVFVVISTGTYAQTKETHKLMKPTPDKLMPLCLVGDGCPVGVIDVEKLVDGILIRSRIKPLDTWDNEMYMAVNVICTKQIRHSGLISFSVLIFFAKPAMATVDGDLAGIDRFVYADQLTDYWGIGLAQGGGEKDHLMKVLRNSVEMAVTDFMAVNFGL